MPYDENGNVYDPTEQHGAYPRAGSQGAYQPPNFRTNGPGRTYPPKKRSRWGVAVGIAVAVLVLLGCAFGALAIVTAAEQSTAGVEPGTGLVATTLPTGPIVTASKATAMPDVTVNLTKCGPVNSFGVVDLEGTVVNNRDTARSISVQVNYEDKDGKVLGQDILLTVSLGAGKSYQIPDGYLGEGKLDKCIIGEVMSW